MLMVGVLSGKSPPLVKLFIVVVLLALMASMLEVYPKSIVRAGTTMVSGEESLLNALSPLACDIHITREIIYSITNYKRVGECYTWVKGPRIYSIDGLQVSFKIYAYYKPSAVYIEKFYDFDHAYYYWQLRHENAVQWKSSGKKLTPSVITGQTSPLTGNYSDQVYFKVRYVYEHYRGCVTMAGCYAYWLLYPIEIGGVARSGEGPPLPYDVRPYTPPSPPNYAHLGFPGTVEIYFADYETVISLPFIQIVIRYDQYTTPTVIINSTRNYWWWFRDDDKTTYEVLVTPR
jgi:hypothetical protein